MLQADKQVLLAGVKQQALELRQKELDFNVERYTNLATQASVVAGFSFESLVELEVPEDCPWPLASAYFVCGACAMSLSLYVLCVGSFAVVFGHRLALQGPHGSLERAVHILVAHRNHLFFVAGVSLAFLVLAAMLMAWIKMGAAASVVTCVFAAFFVTVALRMNGMVHLFEIPEDMLVTGAVRVNAANNTVGAIDLAQLNPGSRAAVYAAIKEQQAGHHRHKKGKQGEHYMPLHEEGDEHAHQDRSHHVRFGPRVDPRLDVSNHHRAFGIPTHHAEPPSVAAACAAPQAPAASAAGSPSPPPVTVRQSSGSSHGISRLAHGLGAGISNIGHNLASHAHMPHVRSSNSLKDEVTRATGGLHHEGYLFKKGEHSHFPHSEAPRRRYFVLQGVYLYYFKTWEDYGSGGVHSAVNHSHPIDMSKYEPMVLTQANDGANRFDLVPKADPLARKWELQAITHDELRDWLAALKLASSALEASARSAAGQDESDKTAGASPHP